MIFRSESAILFPYRYLHGLQGKDGTKMAAVAVKLIGSVLVIGLIGLLLEDKFIFQKYE